MDILAASEAVILVDKDYEDPSVFTASGLLREARRQKGITDATVPKVCVLDPDGDLVRHLQQAGRVGKHPNWACYHTDLLHLREPGFEIGVVGCAVGAPFAVLVAEQLFESGCRLLISITSAGQLVPLRPPPYFVLIERALRDEGTSHHYLAPARFAHAPRSLLNCLRGSFDDVSIPLVRGATWTTDAPFRETAAAITKHRAEGLLAVEMEAAALYAFAAVRRRDVICFAMVTNQMAQTAVDFEKGEADGSAAALSLIRAIMKRTIERT